VRQNRSVTAAAVEPGFSSEIVSEVVALPKTSERPPND